MNFDYLTPTTTSTSKNVESLTNIEQYIQSTSSSVTDFTDLYPFTSESWAIKNLAGFNKTLNRYDTTKSLVINSDKKFITNYKPYNEKENVPFINGVFSQISEPEVANFPNISNFYTARNTTKNYLVTEGPVVYQGNTGNVVATQTTSMLNTPFFTNSLLESISFSS